MIINTINISIVGMFLCLVSSGCSSTKKFKNYLYETKETQNGMTTISFDNDSTFLIRSAVHGKLLSQKGRWSAIDEELILLKINSDYGDSLRINSTSISEDLDIGEDYYKSVFPTVTIDTVFFNENFNSFILKGYEFEKAKRKKKIN